MPGMWTRVARRMISDLMTEAIGFTAGILGLIAWIPQIVRVWSKGQHEGISLLTLASILTTLALWTIYGFLINSLSMIISNGAAFALIGLVYIGVIRLRYFSPKQNAELKSKLQSIRTGGIV